MAYNFKNLVFEGGGVKGIAYIGAVDVQTVPQVSTNCPYPNPRFAERLDFWTGTAGS